MVERKTNSQFSENGSVRVQVVSVVITNTPGLSSVTVQSTTWSVEWHPKEATASRGSVSPASTSTPADSFPAESSDEPIQTRASSSDERPHPTARLANARRYRDMTVLPTVPLAS